MTNRQPWSEQENAALVALYFDMLDKAQAAQPYNKAAMIRSRQYIDGSHQPLSSRSRGSIELKLMNASAAHRDIADADAATMHYHGYRALSNYQQALKEAMREALTDHENERYLQRYDTTHSA